MARKSTDCSLPGRIAALSDDQVAAADSDLHARYQALVSKIQSDRKKGQAKSDDLSAEDKAKRTLAEELHGFRFADPANKKYGLNDSNGGGKPDATDVRAAWNYLHQQRNASKYSSGELSAIERRIEAAARECGVKLDTDDKATNSAAACSVLPEGDAPEWIELLPIGEMKTRDGRGPYKLTDVEGVIKATQALDMSAGIPIDYDHATDFASPHGAPAPAAGWIVGFKAEGGKLLGQVNWTEAGAKAVALREYRYLSPVFDYDKHGNVVRILRAALTNNPNLYMTAISSRKGRTAMAESTTMSADEFKNRMAEVHGLDADASHEDILDASRGRKAAHEKHHKSVDEARACEDAGGPDELDDDDDDKNAEAMVARMIASGKVVSHEAHAKLVTEVSELKTARAREHAEHTVDEAIRGGRLFPAQREWGIAYCARDEKSFNEFIAKQPRLDLGADGRLTGSMPAGGPESAAASSLTASEIAICSSLGLTPTAFAASKGVPLRIDPTLRLAKADQPAASK